MENSLHAERSPPSFRTIRTPTSCQLYHRNTLHTQGILLPSRTIGKKNGPKQPHKTNISPTQAKYILGTSHSCEPEQSQLILDHAGKRH